MRYENLADFRVQTAVRHYVLFTEPNINTFVGSNEKNVLTCLCIIPPTRTNTFPMPIPNDVRTPEILDIGDSDFCSTNVLYVKEVSTHCIYQVTIQNGSRLLGHTVVKYD